MASKTASPTTRQNMTINYNEQIDALLERYLVLLDEYTTLRTRLATLQSGIYQDVARANFGADRGIRYGQDFYQARESLMALRRLEITRLKDKEDHNHLVPSFKVVEWRPDVQKEQRGGSEDGIDGLNEKEDDGDGAAEQEPKDEGKEKTKAKRDNKEQNPLQWFGFMAPQALRSAQSHAITLVQEVIPRLASVTAEMLDVEIEIGRARKKRAKADAATSKSQVQETSTTASQRRPIATA
jgi:hypothetical protein